MKFSLITAILTGASVVVAMPTSPLKRQTDVCPGTDSNAQCCATDVLGVADLNCFNPPSTPTSVADFVEICAAQGQQAKCCLLPILDQALVCQDPEG